MANRYSSQKTQAWWELTEGAAPTRLGPGLKSISLSSAGKSEIDATGVDDDASFTLGGIEQASTWSLSIPYDPLDADHETLRTTPSAVQTSRTLQLRFYQTGGAGVGRMLEVQSTMTKAEIQVAENSALYLAMEFKLLGAVTRPLIPA